MIYRMNIESKMLKFLPKCSSVTSYILCIAIKFIGIFKKARLNEDIRGVESGIHRSRSQKFSILGYRAFSLLHEQCPLLGAKPCINHLTVINIQPDYNGSCTKTTLIPRVSAIFPSSSARISQCVFTLGEVIVTGQEKSDFGSLRTFNIKLTSPKIVLSTAPPSFLILLHSHYYLMPTSFEFACSALSDSFSFFLLTGLYK